MNSNFNLKEVIVLPEPNLPTHAIFWSIDVFSKSRMMLSCDFYNTKDLTLMNNHKPINAIFNFSKMESNVQK